MYHFRTLHEVATVSYFVRPLCW